jgi:predicted negative regulator of RcsB-dependent stress response
VLVAKSQTKEAKAAYQVALDKAGKDDNAFRRSVRIRLEALGG